jgi:hypothetical protein
MTREEFQPLMHNTGSRHRGPLPDFWAMALLQDLVKHDHKIISAAEHDIIYLSTDVDKLLAVIAPDQAILLASYGVLYDEDRNSLYMYV